MALEKLKLEQVLYFLMPLIDQLLLNCSPYHSHLCQDVTGENENDTKKKKDVARLLKTALGVELKEKLIGSLLVKISLLVHAIIFQVMWVKFTQNCRDVTPSLTLHIQVFQTVLPVKPFEQHLRTSGAGCL